LPMPFKFLFRTLGTRSTRERSRPRNRLIVDLLEDRTLLNAAWLVKLDGLQGNTRGEQIVQAQQRFDAAGMYDQQVRIIDPMGDHGVVLVQTPEDTTDVELEAKLAAVKGFDKLTEFEPDEARSGEIPVEVGPEYEDEGDEEGDGGDDDDGGD